MRAWTGVCLFLVCATAHAECPATREFRAWVDELSSDDPLIQLGTALTPPPQRGAVIDGACLATLLATENTHRRGLLIASIAEGSVADREFIELVARDLTAADKTLVANAVIALSRRGAAAVPVLFDQFRTARLDDPGLRGKGTACTRRLPWAAASRALERIGDSAVPELLRLAIAQDEWPTDPCGATPRTALSYVLRVLSRLRPESLVALYEAHPTIVTGPDKAEFLENVLDTDDLESLLALHPELIPLVGSRSLGPWDPAALLAALNGDKAAERRAALRVLLRYPGLVDASEIRKALVDGLRPRSSSFDREYVELVIGSDLGAFANDSFAAEMASMLESGPLDVRLAAWKVLRDLGRARLGDLHLLLLAAVNEIRDDPADANDFFAAARSVLTSADHSELLAGLPERQTVIIQLLLEALACSGDAQRTAATLAAGSAAALGPNLALALAAQLAVCVNDERYDLRVDDVAEARAQFWGILHDTLITQDYVALVLRTARLQPDAMAESAFDDAIGDLLQRVPPANPYLDEEWTDPVRTAVPATPLLREAAETPALVAHLKLGLRDPDFYYREEYAALLEALERASTDDVAALVEQLRTPGEPDFETRDRIAALIVLGESGVEALHSVMEDGPNEARIAIIDALAHRSSPRVTESFRLALNDADQQVRVHAMRALLATSDVASVGAALRANPADVSELVALSQTTASPLYAAAFVDALAGNRTGVRAADSALRKELEEALAGGNENRPGSLAIAARLERGSRRLLERALDDPCIAVRAVAFSAIIRAARSSEEHRRVVRLLRNGRPFRSSARSSDECPPDEPRYASFATGEELAGSIAAAEVEAPPVLRDFVSAAAADRSPLTEIDDLFVTTLWALEELERHSSSETNHRAADDVLRRVLRSQCDECQVALEGVIARRPRGAQVVLAAAVQRQIRDFASDNRYLDSSPEEIIVTGSRISVASMPRIALWSPSDRMELPTRFVDRWATFGDATDELIEALENAGYDRHGLFAVDGGGIALITGLERTHADGTPLPPRQRWTAAEDSEVTSISDFIARLFLGESGNYRMIAFVITPQLPPIAAGSVLTAETSKVLYMSGETTLPRVLASKLIEDSRCFVLIYEYERRPGEMVQHIPGAYTALFHLTAGGILESLEALR